MIYIITPCSRPENLAAISKTIPSECKWIVVHDNKKTAGKTKMNEDFIFLNQDISTIYNAIFLVCEDTGPVGTKARNYALDTLSLQDDDFILFHDDDNIIHPKWYETISQYLENDFSIMTWGQINKHRRVRLSPTKYPRVGQIDTACFLVRWKYNKRVRHGFFYEHDGVYAEDCAKNGRVLCINDYLCYYNYLR
jgi:hypothetical protein